MAITSSGFTGTVDQAAFSRLDGGGYGDGMVGSVPGGANLRVDRVVGQDRRVTIQAGDSKVPGVRATNTAVATYDLPANGSGSARLDWVVMRYSWASSPGTVVFTHVQGTPAATPSRPALVQTAGVQWDVPLALVRVDAGVGALPADAVTDARYWEYNGLTVVQQRLVDPTARPGRILYVAGTKEILTSDGAAAWTSLNPARTAAALTLQTGWAQYGAPHRTPGISYTSDGDVRLTGLVKRTGAAVAVDSNPGVQIATVPTGARPDARLSFDVTCLYDFARVNVETSGAVVLLRQSAVSWDTNGWVSLDGVAYRTS